MTQIKKYPSIGQYRDAIVNITNSVRYSGRDEDDSPIYNNNILPILRYKFTAKTHGSNGSIAWLWNDKEYYYDFINQSRERIITPMDDNYNFSATMHRVGDDVLQEKLLLPLLNKINKQSAHYGKSIEGERWATNNPDVRIYGEWGGKSVQQTVGTSKVDKFFIIFGIKVGGLWVNDDILRTVKCESERIYNICDVPFKEIEIDFNNPGDYTKIFEEWVAEIEAECPVAKMLGIDGGIGEGWVGKPMDPIWHHGRYFFKIKGEEHKTTTKSQKRKVKITISPEKLKDINELVERVCDEGRMAQGVSWLVENGHPIVIQSMGIYIKWLINDILKEELDTILNVDGVVSPKEVTKYFSTKGVEYFKNYLNTRLGL